MSFVHVLLEELKIEVRLGANEAFELVITVYKWVSC